MHETIQHKIVCSRFLYCMHRKSKTTAMNIATCESMNGSVKSGIEKNVGNLQQAYRLLAINLSEDCLTAPKVYQNLRLLIYYTTELDGAALRKGFPNITFRCILKKWNTGSIIGQRIFSNYFYQSILVTFPTNYQRKQE